jgi:hypothetical protein
MPDHEGDEQDSDSGGGDHGQAEGEAVRPAAVRKGSWKGARDVERLRSSHQTILRART